MNHFVNEGLNLVQRAQEAILEEYGHGKKDDMAPTELTERRKMFEVTYLENEDCKVSQQQHKSVCEKYQK